jgi:hypothetical protein
MVVSLVRLGYEGSPKYLMRDLLRHVTKRAADGQLAPKDMASVSELAIHLALAWAA